MKNFYHPLMKDNFTNSDISSVIKLLKKKKCNFNPVFKRLSV